MNGEETYSQIACGAAASTWGVGRRAWAPTLTNPGGVGVKDTGCGRREKTQSGGGGVWWPSLQSPRHDPRGQKPEVEARANRGCYRR
ncbi:hypothetical protein V501_09826 [Pseudogymnoascus sp. VKM F-4519 (FW-2642)]|nr:hypothetical protein V501_09826 [Pseudogymnoascus sp. VKM F-4519 (FW-2642)]